MDSTKLFKKLFILATGLCFISSVLELDLGDKGDTFGDTYDVYLVNNSSKDIKIYKDFLPLNGAPVFTSIIKAVFNCIIYFPVIDSISPCNKLFLQHRVLLI